jgi:hypothetical protein
MVLRNGDIVFILIPRRHAILMTTHVKKTLGSLHALHTATAGTETQGKSRIVVAEDGGKYARKREGRKMTKIRSLEQVLPSQALSLEKEFLTRNAIFFSGTLNGMFPNPVRNSIARSVVNHLNVIDTVDGAQMVLRNGDIVFILIPRHHAILKTTHVKKTLGSLHALHTATAGTETRGKLRIVVAEDGGKYATVGLKPSRGSTGIRESWPPNFTQGNKKEVIKLMTACEEVARSYLPSHVLRGIKNAKRLGNWPKILDGAVGAMYAALSSSLNSYLNSHMDQDFLYLLLTMASSRGLQERINQCDVHNVDICFFLHLHNRG